MLDGRKRKLINRINKYICNNLVYSKRCEKCGGIHELDVFKIFDKNNKLLVTYDNYIVFCVECVDELFIHNSKYAIQDWIEKNQPERYWNLFDIDEHSKILSIEELENILENLISITGKI